MITTYPDDLIIGTSLTQPIPLSVSDCRGIVKTLVCGMKTITWGAGSCKIPGKVDFCKSHYCVKNIHYDCVWLSFNFVANQTPKVFLPHETEQFVRLFRYGLVALDIYRVTTLPSGSYSLRSAKYVNYTVVP